MQRNSAIVFPVPALVTTASQTCVVRPACTLVATVAIRPSRAVPRKFDFSSIVVNPARALGQQRAGGQAAGGVGQADHGGGVQVAVGREQVGPDVERGLQPAGLVRGDRSPSRPGQRARAAGR